jgi:hypothetical protein
LPPRPGKMKRPESAPDYVAVGNRTAKRHVAGIRPWSVQILEALRALEALKSALTRSAPAQVRIGTW